MRYYIPYLNRSTVTESLPKLHLAEQQHIIEAHIRAVPSMRQCYARKVIIGNFQLKIREHMDNFSLYPPYLSWRKSSMPTPLPSSSSPANLGHNNTLAEIHGCHQVRSGTRDVRGGAFSSGAWRGGARTKIRGADWSLTLTLHCVYQLQLGSRCKQIDCAEAVKHVSVLGKLSLTEVNISP